MHAKPLAIDTRLTNSQIDTMTLAGIEDQGIRLKPAVVQIAPAITAWKIWSLVAIMEAVD